MTREALILSVIESTQKLLHQKGKNSWDLMARPEQLLPHGNWYGWFLLAGRGFGKTRTGSESIKKLIQMGYRRICLIGATLQEARRVMVEGESGLMSISPEARYYPSLGSIVWPNGAEAQIFTAENPEALRGPQFDCAWLDEFLKFKNPQSVWEQLIMTLRLGQPRAIITSTPRPIPILKQLIKDPNILITRGTTLDNIANLPKPFLDSILQYEKTPFARQEIYGEILDDIPPIWSVDSIQHLDEIPSLEEVIISIDPAVSDHQASDETGIIVIGKTAGCFYVLYDYSSHWSVLDWSQKAIQLYYKYQARKIIIETNKGGELSKTLLLQLDPKVSIYEVRASKNKYTRAQQASILYLKGLVYHTRHLYELENQMLNFEQLTGSPDRVDALVWGLYYLNQPSCGAYII